MLRQPFSAKRLMSSQNTSSVSVEPTGWKRASGRRGGRWRRLPEWAKSQSRPPQERWKGWVLASLMAPQVAERMWTTNREVSRCSQARMSSERMEPWGGAGSLSTEAEGSPPG
jgi:hypothetical protein